MYSSSYNINLYYNQSLVIVTEKDNAQSEKAYYKSRDISKQASRWQHAGLGKSRP